MFRFVSIATLLALAGGCSSLPDNTELNTPFGSFEISGAGEKVRVEPGGAVAAKGRVLTSRVTIDDETARLRDLETCVSRTKYNANVDPCLCYFAYNFPAPRNCNAGDAPAVPTEPPPVLIKPAPTADPTESDTLRDTIKAAEGGPFLNPHNGHICWGHWIRPKETFVLPMSLPDCERLLDVDIAQARIESMRVFGRADDARVELCYWTGCSRFADGRRLDIAVRDDPLLLKIGSARAERLANAIETRSKLRPE